MSDDITIFVEGMTQIEVVEISIPGIQGVSGSQATVHLIASENIAAGSFVNIWSGGVRLANATDGTRPCDGYAAAAILTGQGGDLIVGRGQVITGMSGLTEGTDYWLSTTAGQLVNTAPSTPGNLVQYVGKAVDTATLIFVPERGIIL